MRDGSAYLEALRDSRTVFLHGEQVEDVTRHPAFTGITRSIAKLYDVSADPANGMQFTTDSGAGVANKVFMIPRSRDDLVERRLAISRWAALSHGFIGRSPDHVGGFLAGFAGAADLFDRDGRAFGSNVTNFYRRLLEEDLFVSYVIVPPQMDREKATREWDDEFLQVGVAEEREDGIVVRGAQMLGTSSAVSDYLYVSCIKPLRFDEEAYALAFVTPLAAEGVRLLCRRPYGSDQPSGFDYPMSTRFDETDALVVFDDVLVPWEHVFVYRDVELTRDQWHVTAAHSLGNNQAQIRLIAKMQFIVGVARRIVEVNGIERIPSVREKLADLASLAGTVEGMVLASEAAAIIDEHGVARPHPRFLYGAMGLQDEIYPRALHLLRVLVGAGVVQVPSSLHDLTSPRTGPYVERYGRSPGISAQERIKLFKLAWDVIGSEFAGRHYQYEMFYAGAPFVAKGYVYDNYGFDEPVRDVEDFLASYSAADPDGF